MSFINTIGKIYNVTRCSTRPSKWTFKYRINKTNFVCRVYRIWSACPKNVKHYLDVELLIICKIQIIYVEIFDY